MENIKKKRREATRKLNLILEIEREFNKTYPGWPSTDDIYNYQRMISGIIEVSEYLGERDNKEIERCKELISVIRRLHNASMDKKYVLYREITDLIIILHKDLKVVISVLAKRMQKKFKADR